MLRHKQIKWYYLFVFSILIVLSAFLIMIVINRPHTSPSITLYNIVYVTTLLYMLSIIRSVFQVKTLYDSIDDLDLFTNLSRYIGFNVMIYGLLFIEILINIVSPDIITNLVVFVSTIALLILKK